MFRDDFSTFFLFTFIHDLKYTVYLLRYCVIKGFPTDVSFILFVFGNMTAAYIKKVQRHSFDLAHSSAENKLR
jgi:hypothetical protein